MYRVELCTELFFCYHPYHVSMLFADLLSLHLVTFLIFFYSCTLSGNMIVLWYVLDVCHVVCRS